MVEDSEGAEIAEGVSTASEPDSETPADAPQHVPESEDERLDEDTEVLESGSQAESLSDDDQDSEEQRPDDTQWMAAQEDYTENPEPDEETR
ncbi:MAG: hypothetical protein ABW095_11075 [Candidatus Thiodiazotropha sp.]